LAAVSPRYCRPKKFKNVDSTYYQIWGLPILAILNLVSRRYEKLPKDPVFGTWYYLSFLNRFVKEVSGTKCYQQIFKKFARSKNGVFFGLFKKNFKNLSSTRYQKRGLLVFRTNAEMIQNLVKFYNFLECHKTFNIYYNN
jgi:hypothetical protein